METDKKIIMKCGCVNDSHMSYPKEPQKEPKACCSLHGTTEPAQTQPNLDKRIARCAYFAGKCGHSEPSSIDLAFFKYCEGKEYDEYYCGCYGWD